MTTPSRVTTIMLSSAEKPDSLRANRNPQRRSTARRGLGVSIGAVTFLKVYARGLLPSVVAAAPQNAPPGGGPGGGPRPPPGGGGGSAGDADGDVRSVLQRRTGPPPVRALGHGDRIDG